MAQAGCCGSGQVASLGNGAEPPTTSPTHSDRRVSRGEGRGHSSSGTPLSPGLAPLGAVTSAGHSIMEEGGSWGSHHHCPPRAALPGALQPGLAWRLPRAQGPAPLPGLAVPPPSVPQPARDPTGDGDSGLDPLRLQPGGDRAEGQRWGWCQEGAGNKPGGGRGCVPVQGTHGALLPGGLCQSRLQRARTPHSWGAGGRKMESRDGDMKVTPSWKVGQQGRWRGDSRTSCSARA